MHFFDTHNLETHFPHQPAVRELIEIILASVPYLQADTGEQGLEAIKAQNFVIPFQKLLANTAHKQQHSLSPILEQLLVAEATDLAANPNADGTTAKPVNKVIFANTLEKELSFAKAEFHSHTYDIQIVLAQREQMIFHLGKADPVRFLENDPDNNTQFTRPTKEFKTITLIPGEGVVIAPGIEHFGCFKPDNCTSDKPVHVTKIIVKIDVAYAKLLNLA